MRPGLPEESKSSQQLTARDRRSLVCMTGEALWISSVTISAPDPRALAAFYQRLLGWTVTASEGPRPGESVEAGWAQLRAPDGVAGLTTINIEYEKHFVRPTWPSSPGTQHITVHLDLPTTDVDAAERHAIEAGAVTAQFQPQDGVRVMIDPAGHPFCLFQT